MGLLDGLERLINEHGSASILRERIALADDQYAALEKQVDQLKSENDRLRLDYEECKKQRRALENQLAEQSVHGKVLEKSQIDILLLLSKSAAGEDEVVTSLGRSKESTRFDLVELADAGLIEYKNLYGMGTQCSLTQDGRRYLKANGLLM